MSTEPKVPRNKQDTKKHIRLSGWFWISFFSVRLTILHYYQIFTIW